MPDGQFDDEISEELDPASESTDNSLSRPTSARPTSRQANSIESIVSDPLILKAMGDLNIGTFLFKCSPFLLL